MTSNWAAHTAGGAGRSRQLPTGILLGFGSFAVVVAGFVASAVPTEESGIRYGVLVGTVLIFTALVNEWAAASAAAVVGFLVFDGFLVNQLGELSWHGSADLSRLLALAAAVTFGRLLGDGYRSYRLVRGSKPRAAAAPVASHQEIERHA